LRARKLFMQDVTVGTLPAEYTRAVKKELQGTIVDVSYPVRNYIDASRRLVTDRIVDSRQVGRETVSGDPIRKSCHVYLPPGYDEQDQDTRYDVLYLLHGVGGDRDEWLQVRVDGHPVIFHILDNLIANRDIEPLIVVFPNGRSAHDWADRSFNMEGTNLLGFYYFDYELRHDLLPFIESAFKTQADIRRQTEDRILQDREHRAIAGLSMGGMQCLNLVLGGYRSDAARYIGSTSEQGKGLHATVRAPGMTDLFAYVGAFSNAPTSSDGTVLGDSVASGHLLRLLYMTCGDGDGISMRCYTEAIAGLAERAGERLGSLYQVLIRDGVHDFGVWNNGAYNFLRLAFRESGEGQTGRHVAELTLPSG
jgi:S-formylglutathione hydrolase FrmB